MIFPESPFVRILIWDSYSETNQSTDRGHIALETHTGVPNDLSKYISFWIDEHSKCINKLHFHSSEEEDDKEVGKKSTSSYLFTSFLNVNKINEAFEAFKANPQAWGALGWGILGKVYPRNQRGLTLYLLEKGGFNLLNTDGNHKFNSLLKNVFVTLGYLYSGLNLFLSYRVNYIFNIFKKDLPKCCQTSSNLFHIFSLTTERIENCELYASKLKTISTTINLMKDKNMGSNQRALNQHTTDAIEFLDKLKNNHNLSTEVTSSDKKLSGFLEYLNMAGNVSRNLLVVSIITAVSVSIFNYFCNVFFYYKLSNKQIRTLVENYVCTSFKQ